MTSTELVVVKRPETQQERLEGMARALQAELTGAPWPPDSRQHYLQLAAVAWQVAEAEVP